MPAAANDPVVGRVARQIEQSTTDLVRGGTAWMAADQTLNAGALRYQQILTQVYVLEVQRQGLLANPFGYGQATALSVVIAVYRSQAEQLGGQLVVLNQAMTRQYEALHALQVAVDRAGVANPRAPPPNSPKSRPI